MTLLKDEEPPRHPDGFPFHPPSSRTHHPALKSEVCTASTRAPKPVPLRVAPRRPLSNSLAITPRRVGARPRERAASFTDEALPRRLLFLPLDSPTRRREVAFHCHRLLPSLPPLMAGRGEDGNGYGSQRVTPGHQNQRTAVTRQTRSEVFSDLLQVARRQGIFDRIRTGTSTAEALQLCLDRAVAMWEFCVVQANALAVEVDTETGEPVGFFVEAPTPADPFRVVPNKWVAYERMARQDIETLAGDMTRLGIAERQVRVLEAQAALVAASVRDAAMEAGIPPDQVRALGEALRRRLTDPHTRADLSPKADPASGHESPQVRAHLPSASRSQSPSTSREVGKDGPGH